jgi:hypothetical protein
MYHCPLKGWRLPEDHRYWPIRRYRPETGYRRKGALRIEELSISWIGLKSSRVTGQALHSGIPKPSPGAVSFTLNREKGYRLYVAFLKRLWYRAHDGKV